MGCTSKLLLRKRCRGIISGAGYAGRSGSMAGGGGVLTVYFWDEIYLMTSTVTGVQLAYFNPIWYILELFFWFIHAGALCVNIYIYTYYVCMYV